MNYIKLDLSRFKKASKKLLSESKGVHQLSEMQELLARSLGFRNLKEVMKSFDGSTRQCNISLCFKNKSPEQIWNQYFANKKHESQSDVDVWYFRTKFILIQVLEINFFLYKNNFMDYTFKNALTLISNFEYIYQIFYLAHFNKHSTLFPSLKQEDLKELNLKSISSLPFISDPLYKDIANEKWIDVTMIFHVLLRDYVIIEGSCEREIDNFAKELFVFRDNDYSKDMNPLSSNNYLILNVLRNSSAVV